MERKFIQEDFQRFLTESFINVNCKIEMAYMANILIKEIFLEHIPGNIF